MRRFGDIRAWLNWSKFIADSGRREMRPVLQLQLNQSVASCPKRNHIFNPSVKPHSAHSTVNSPQRLDSIDALRGLAMVWMTAFHFSFDLNYFGFIQQNFYENPFWTWQRTLIVSMFLFCAGLGQAIAVAQGQTWPRFWRRWLKVAGCAMLVSIGSWLMFPQSFIYFGVLHGMAVMLILARLTVSLGPILWVLGALAIASKFVAAYALSSWAPGPIVEIFNSPALNWLGWITQKPFTEDYVPILPWLGVMWWGVAFGAKLASVRPELLDRRTPRMFRPLVCMGRWSLPYYMLHQPVMIGALSLIGFIR